MQASDVVSVAPVCVAEVVFSDDSCTVLAILQELYPFHPHPSCSGSVSIQVGVIGMVVPVCVAAGVFSDDGSCVLATLQALYPFHPHPSGSGSVSIQLSA